MGKKTFEYYIKQERKERKERQKIKNRKVIQTLNQVSETITYLVLLIGCFMGFALYILVMGECINDGIATPGLLGFLIFKEALLIFLLSIYYLKSIEIYQKRK